MNRQEVAAGLARRMTDKKIGACSPSPRDRTRCETHSEATVLFRLPPGGKCMIWRDARSANESAIEAVIDDPVAKDILLEVWDA